MATSTANLNAKLFGSYGGTADDGGALSTQWLVDLSLGLASGTGAGNTDLVYISPTTATASTSGVTYDLAGTSLVGTALVDRFGTTINFASVCAFYFHNASTTAAEVIKLGGAATNQWLNFLTAGTDLLSIQAGQYVLSLWTATGANVTATTGDQFKILSASGSPAYEMIIVGHSA